MPEGWTIIKLEDAVALYQGYIFKSNEYSNTGRYPIVTIANVQRGKMVMDSYNSIDFLPPDLQSHQKLVYGDFLISMTGNVGRVCLVTKNGCLLNQRVGKIVPNQKYDSRYIYSILNSDDFLSSMIDSATGGAQPNLSKKDILEYEFSIPRNRKEQQRIAEALSDVDALIASLEKLIAKKKAIKQGAMQRLLTGKTRLPGFEGEWKRDNLANAITLYNGYAFKSSEYTQSGKYPVITIANVHRGKMVMDSYNTIDYFPSDLQSYQKLVNGDCLISMTGNVGRVCLVNQANCLLNQRVGKIVPNGLYDSNFIYWILNTDDFLETMVELAKGGA